MSMSKRDPTTNLCLYQDTCTSRTAIKIHAHLKRLLPPIPAYFIKHTTIQSQLRRPRHEHGTQSFVGHTPQSRYRRGGKELTDSRETATASWDESALC